MRTPISSQTPMAQRELADALTDGLAALLVQEYHRRHRQQNPQLAAPTVASPRGPDHPDDEPADQEDR